MIELWRKNAVADSDAGALMSNQCRMWRLNKNGPASYDRRPDNRPHSAFWNSATRRILDRKKAKERTMTDQPESKVASRDVKRAVRLRSYSTGRRENQWKQKPSDKQSNLWTFEFRPRRAISSFKNRQIDKRYCLLDVGGGSRGWINCRRARPLADGAIGYALGWLANVYLRGRVIWHASHRARGHLVIIIAMAGSEYRKSGHSATFQTRWTSTSDDTAFDWTPEIDVTRHRMSPTMIRQCIPIIWLAQPGCFAVQSFRIAVFFCWVVYVSKKAIFVWIV